MGKALAIAAPKHAGGRPTLYRREYCQRIVELMAEGRSLEGCAALVGVHPDSLYEWQHRHPEFSDAVRAGRAAALAWWERRAIEMASGAPGNARIVILALMNRSRSASGWHNTQRIEHTGPAGGPVQLETLDVGRLTPDQRGQLRSLLAVAELVHPNP